MRYHFLLLILFTGVLFGQNKRIESNDIRFYGPKFFCLEGTVDGLHFTDLGFLRYANFLLTELKDNKLLD